jgi:glycosyltransferase involved in cell wall biosynthesis
MTAQPSVSVLIPTYNRASWLPATLESVFRQTLPVAEVLLVDDGSTDNTRDVVELLLEQNPGWQGRLRYLYQPNQGKSAALNLALPMARGEWIAFNDSDDAWLPEKLERQFHALARFPECDACFTESSIGEFRDRHPEYLRNLEDGIGKVESPSRLFVARWPGIYMQTVLVRARTMRAFGQFDRQYRISEDVDFLFRLGLLTPFCFVDRPLVEIHREPARPGGLMTRSPARSWATMLTHESMFGKWMSLLPGESPLCKSVRRALALERSALANRYLLAGHLGAARRRLWQGIKEHHAVPLIAKLVLLYAAPGLVRRIVRRRAPLEFHEAGVPARSAPQIGLEQTNAIRR